MKISDVFPQDADNTVFELANIAELIRGFAANTIERTWTMIDSAAETDLPSNYLSQQAVFAIQGIKVTG